MVDFETEVYNKAGDNITGVKVVVLGETGEVLDTIQVHNKTQFDALVTELNAKLDVIDEKYIQAEDSQLQGLSIEEILENSNDNVDINATSLGGVNSGNFSQIGHTHSKSNIADLYDYQISCNSRNITLGESVNITVQVNNQNNQGVSGAPVQIDVNHSPAISGYADTQGKFTSSYTPDTVGLHCFSVKNQSEFVNVKSVPGSTIQKATVITGKCDVYYDPNLKLCQVIVNGSFSIGNTGSLGSNVLSNFKPKITMPMAVFTTGLNISIADSTGNISYVNNSGSTGSKTVVASAMYWYK